MPAGAVGLVRVVYDGHIVNTPAPVVQLSRGTLVPLRPVATALGGRMEWDEAAEIAVVRYRGRRLEVDQKAHMLRLDGQALAGLVDPRTAGGHLLVPLAGIERLFGVRGQWLPRRHLLSFAALRKPGAVTGRAASRGAGQPAANTQPAASTSGLRLRLTSDRPTYRVGSPIMLTLTVTNPARAAITLQFSSSQHYDFEVRHAGQTVWRWSASRMFAQALTSLTIGPGERRVFAESWNQQDNSGQTVPAGTYEAVATLTTMARPQLMRKSVSGLSTKRSTASRRRPPAT